MIYSIVFTAIFPPPSVILGEKSPKKSVALKNESDTVKMYTLASCCHTMIITNYYSIIFVMRKKAHLYRDILIA